MSATPTIPQEIVDRIIEELARGHTSEMDPAIVETSLKACAIVSRSFYWAASRFIFQSVHLSMTPVYDGGKRRTIPPQAIASITKANLRLRRFTEIITQNHNILPSIQSLQIDIDPHLLIIRKTGELWNILECVLRGRNSLKSVAIIGATYKPWPWLSIVQDTKPHLASFIQVMQMATDNLRLEGILIHPIDRLLSRFTTVRRISISGVKIDRRFAQIPHQIDLPLSAVAIINPLLHIQNVLINLGSTHDVEMTDALLKICFPFVVALEMNFLWIGLYSAYGLRADLACFPELRTLRVSLILRAYTSPSGYGWNGYNYHTTMLVIPFYDGPSKPTSIETISINLLLHYEMRELSHFFWDLRNHSPEEPFDPDLDEFTWGGFHPDVFRRKHPNLHELIIGIRLVASYPVKHDDNRRVVEPYEYDADKPTLKVLFAQLVTLKILRVEKEEYAPSDLRKMLHVEVEFL